MDTAKPLLHLMPPWMSKRVIAQLRQDYPNGSGYSDETVRDILEEMRAEIAAVIVHPLGRP